MDDQEYYRLIFNSNLYNYFGYEMKLKSDKSYYLLDVFEHNQPETFSFSKIYFRAVKLENRIKLYNISECNAERKTEKEWQEIINNSV